MEDTYVRSINGLLHLFRSLASSFSSQYLLLFLKSLAEVGDFKIGGKIINKVRFADDTAIIAKTKKELQDKVNRLVETGNMA